MLDVAIRRPDGSQSVDWQHVGVRAVPPLPVAGALRPVLPEGLRRGSTVSVSGSMSLLFALLGAASADGAWCALVGFPRISAEAAAEYGVELGRLALVPAPAASWTTAVGALLDAVDIVAVRPPSSRQRLVDLAPGDIRRLAARARSKDAVLMPFVAAGRTTQRHHDGARNDGWPGADVRLQAGPGSWSGIGEGTGRLRSRQVEVTANGRGMSARPRRATVLLPAEGGGLAEATTLAPVTTLTPVIDLAAG